MALVTKRSVGRTVLIGETGNPGNLLLRGSITRELDRIHQWGALCVFSKAELSHSVPLRD